MTRAAVALLALALALASCGPRDVQAPEALLGHWSGSLAWRDATTPVAMVVTREGDSLAASLDAPELGLHGQPLGRLSFRSPRVHFAWRDSGGAFAFDGWLRRGLVVGAVSSAALGGERNPTLLPQLALSQRKAERRQRPWPAAVVVESLPASPSGPPRALGTWLAERAAR